MEDNQSFFDIIEVFLEFACRLLDHPVLEALKNTFYGIKDLLVDKVLVIAVVQNNEREVR